MNVRKTGLPGLASCTGSGLKWNPVPRTGEGFGANPVSWRKSMPQ